LVTINPDWGTVGNTTNAYAQTTSVSVFSDGVHDIGGYALIDGANYERAFWIVNDLVRTWDYIWLATGYSQSPQETTGSSTVEWKIDSTDGTYYTNGGNVHLTGEDPISDTIVGHEYGHNIMYTVYGDWMPTTYCPDPHYVNGAHHVNCAWTEGWANFLPLAVNDDPVFRWGDGASINLETATWTTSNFDNGASVEGRVAGALWDILDTVNDGDDQYSDGSIINIWDTIYHQNDNSFSEYWSAWKARGHNNTSAGPVMGIYQNTIDFRGGPGNDNYADRVAFNVVPFSVIGLNTAAATTQGIDPITTCAGGTQHSRSVWYSFKPSSSGAYIISTNGSNYDTVLFVVSGPLGWFDDEGCDDDGGTGLQSQLILWMNSNTFYRIEVLSYGTGGSGGSMNLTVRGVDWNIYLPILIR
jgi:hypothetical protein